MIFPFKAGNFEVVLTEVQRLDACHPFDVNHISGGYKCECLTKGFVHVLGSVDTHCKFLVYP
jgi:hypothetical protein